MTLIPELQEALARAVARSTDARAARRWWQLTRGGAVMATSGVLLAGTALAAGPLGLLASGPQAPRAAGVDVPYDQRAALAVLRRPQSDEDRSGEVREVLRVLRRDHIDGVHEGAVRVLRSDRRLFAVLVPAERDGRPESTPPGVRRNVLCLMTSFASSTPRTDVLPVRQKDGSRRRVALGGVGRRCGDLRDLTTTGIQAGNSGVVPDGVARVRIRFRGRRYREAPVRNNFYAVYDRELAPFWGVTWLDAEGRSIDHRR